jgi:hypothetical protein
LLFVIQVTRKANETKDSKKNKARNVAAETELFASKPLERGSLAKLAPVKRSNSTSKKSESPPKKKTKVNAISAYEGYTDPVPVKYHTNKSTWQLDKSDSIGKKKVKVKPKAVKHVEAEPDFNFLTWKTK